MRNRRPVLAAVLVLICLSVFFPVIHARAVDSRSSAQAIPKHYFGFHAHRLASTTPWPVVPFGTWRLWDAYAAWPNLEPEKGRWSFGALDKYIELAEQRGVQVLLPLGLSPSWASARPEEKSSYRPGNAAEPRSLDDWRHYVRSVATRYKGRVRHYEIWNEPNLRGFYSGGIEQLIALAREAHDVLKSVDPAITLVSPSVTGEGKHLEWFDDYLGKGGGRYADVIGYHFYSGQRPPEAMLPLIARVRAIMNKHGVGNKPLWNTEFGWLIDGGSRPMDPASVGFPRDWMPLSMEAAAAYLSRAYILFWSAGVQRNYWYAWDNRAMGLYDEDARVIKPAARGLMQTVRWLVGSIMLGCEQQAPVWICPLSHGGARNAWLVWSPDGIIAWSVPYAWKAKAVERLDGTGHELINEPSLRTISVGPSPILIKGDHRDWGFAHPTPTAQGNN